MFLLGLVIFAIDTNDIRINSLKSLNQQLLIVDSNFREVAINRMVMCKQSIARFNVTLHAYKSRTDIDPELKEMVICFLADCIKDHTDEYMKLRNSKLIDSKPEIIEMVYQKSMCGSEERHRKFITKD